jgi:hypothetical protein
MILGKFKQAALGTSFLFVFLAVQVAGQDSSDLKPKPKPSSSAPTKSPANTNVQTRASLLIVPDVPCRVLLDDKDLGVLVPGHPKSIRVELGDHMIEASATSGHGKWQNTLSIEKPVQVIVKTEIKKALAEEEQAAARQAADLQEQQRQAAAREAQAAETRRIQLAALSAVDGRWLCSEGITTWELTMRRDGEALAGSITQSVHIDSKRRRGKCETTYSSVVGCVGCKETTCAPDTTIPAKNWTNYFILDGKAGTDGRILIKGGYQRCAGDCKPVSNPSSLDVQNDAELRDPSELYWGGMKFKRQ